MMTEKNLKIISSPYELKKLESVRYNAMGKEYDNKVNYHINEVRNAKMMALGLYLEDDLIGGFYVNANNKNVYVDSIFIKKEYQRKGYGKFLYNYILNNEDILETYYHKPFDKSFFDPNTIFTETLNNSFCSYDVPDFYQK